MDVDSLPGFEGLIGQSAAMQALFDRIRRVAPSEVSVLILGETGSGKELVAAAVHRLSRRRGGRFEAVNCGALTRELVRSELFGHERGAFTGAVERRTGLLREADGGTVFLDEIGELAPEAQAMLLRFLGDGEVRAVGASRAGHVDVRLIAATHRDLRAAVGEGRFREDLYYRLRRVVLTVPPLRARLDDVPLLVEHLRRQVNTRHGLAIESVRDDTLARLAACPWPGNVRELEAVLEEAMLLRGRGPLRAEDLALPEPVPAASGGPPPPVSAARRSGSAACRDLALDLAGASGGVSTGELARAAGVGLTLARRELGALVTRGELRRTGRGRAVRYARP
jgi:two-component system, NtrC family, response regulator HydG